MATNITIDGITTVIEHQAVVGGVYRCRLAIRLADGRYHSIDVEGELPVKHWRNISDLGKRINPNEVFRRQLQSKTKA